MPHKFLRGGNLPWLAYGCDFGTNHWRPAGGLSVDPGRIRLPGVLDQMAACGMEVVRWFFFCDGRAGVSFDRSGHPLGLDDRVFADMDAAFDLVAAAGLKIMPVLFDFGWCHRARRHNGVVIGGHRRTVVDATARRDLLERVVRPTVRRYGQHPAIWAWDVINEPEWVTFGLGPFVPWGTVTPRAMRAFLSESVAEIRAHSTHPVTVGLASSRGRRLVADLQLDFDQVHWYDHLDRRAPLDAPCLPGPRGRATVLGEFPTRGSRYTPGQIVDLAERHGYLGAFTWSALAQDAATDWPAAVRDLTGQTRPEAIATAS